MFLPQFIEQRGVEPIVMMDNPQTTTPHRPKQLPDTHSETTDFRGMSAANRYRLSVRNQFETGDKTVEPSTVGNVYITTANSNLRSFDNNARASASTGVPYTGGASGNSASPNVYDSNVSDPKNCPRTNVPFPSRGTNGLPTTNYSAAKKKSIARGKSPNTSNAKGRSGSNGKRKSTGRFQKGKVHASMGYSGEMSAMAKMFANASLEGQVRADKNRNASITPKDHNSQNSNPNTSIGVSGGKSTAGSLLKSYREQWSKQNQKPAVSKKDRFLLYLHKAGITIDREHRQEAAIAAARSDMQSRKPSSEMQSRGRSYCRTNRHSMKTKGKLLRDSSTIDLSNVFMQDGSIVPDQSRGNIFASTLIGGPNMANNPSTSMASNRHRTNDFHQGGLEWDSDDDFNCAQLRVEEYVASLLPKAQKVLMENPVRTPDISPQSQLDSQAAVHEAGDESTATILYTAAATGGDSASPFSKQKDVKWVGGRDRRSAGEDKPSIREAGSKHIPIGASSNTGPNTGSPRDSTGSHTGGWGGNDPDFTPRETGTMMFRASTDSSTEGHAAGKPRSSIENPKKSSVENETSMKSLSSDSSHHSASEDSDRARKKSGISERQGSKGGGSGLARTRSDSGSDRKGKSGSDRKRSSSDTMPADISTGKLAECNFSVPKVMAGVPQSVSDSENPANAMVNNVLVAKKHKSEKADYSHAALDASVRSTLKAALRKSVNQSLREGAHPYTISRQSSVRSNRSNRSVARSNSTRSRSPRTGSAFRHTNSGDYVGKAGRKKQTAIVEEEKPVLEKPVPNEILFIAELAMRQLFVERMKKDLKSDNGLGSIIRHRSELISKENEDRAAHLRRKTLQAKKAKSKALKEAEAALPNHAETAEQVNMIVKSRTPMRRSVHGPSTVDWAVKFRRPSFSNRVWGECFV